MVVAGVEVEAPLALRLRLVFSVAVAKARHHERQGETGCAPLVQLLPRAQLARHVCLRRHVDAVVHPRKHLRPDRGPLERLVGGLQVREMPQEPQPGRLGLFCNQCQLPLDTAVAFGTVNGSVLDRNPKLGQQLPELGVGELVPVIKTSNVQTSIGRRHEFDGVVPDAKGVAEGRTAFVPQKQRPSYVGAVIHHQHTVPRAAGKRRVRPRKVDEDPLQWPPRLDLRLPGNGTPVRLRLATAVAVSPGTRHLDPDLLRGLTCVGVVGVAKGDVQVVTVDAPLLPWPHHRRHHCRRTSAMLHPSSLDVVAGLKLNEVHPAGVKNPGTVSVHEDVVLLLNAVKRH